MYKISENYKNYIESKTSLVPKSKIIVDGIEYLGNVIKSSPKITHKNSKMIGGFPIRTCSFEIYDFNNNLNFIGKEIHVYKGLVIDGNVEYILQGIFIPQEKDVETNISQKTIKFTNIQDKGQFFDVPYKSTLDWSIKHTGLEIVQDACKPLNIELETINFNWAKYEFEQPNFPSNISRREVVSRIAEIGGEIAFISREGKLKISEQNLTNHIIERKRYLNVTREKPFIINTLSLGKEGIEDNIIYPETITEERVEWNILDNPFVDLNRKEMIEKVAQYIIGKSIVPFTLKNFADGYYLDINDVIKVKDKNGDVFNAVILNYETNARINSNVGAETQNQQAVDYNLAGSNKKSLREVSLRVNNIEKNIKAVVETQDEQSKKLTELEISDEGLKESVKETQSQITPTATATGSFIHLEDSTDSPIIQMNIEGKSTQETRSGKNLFNYKDIDSLKDVSIDDDGWITASYDNSSGENLYDIYYFTKSSKNLKPNTNYNLIVEVKNISGNAEFIPITTGYNNTLSQFNEIVSFEFTNLKNNTIYSKIVKANSSFSNSTTMLRSIIRFRSGTSGSITFRISVLEDTTISPEQFVYEPYGAMPSPEFPSEIKSVKGIKNLCEKMIIINTEMQYRDAIRAEVELKSNTEYTIIFESDVSGNSLYSNETLFTSQARFNTKIGTNTLHLVTKENVDKNNIDHYSNGWRLLKNNSNNKLANYTNLMIIEGYVENASYVPFGNWLKIEIIGKNIVNFGKPSGNNCTTSIFENDILTVTSIKGNYSYNYVWYDLTDLIKSNSGKKLSFDCDSFDATNLNRTTIAQLIINNNDGTTSYPELFTKTTKKLYDIPSDTSSIKSVRLCIYTNNSSTQDTEGKFSIVINKPMIFFGTDNSSYEPYKSSTTLLQLDEPLRSLPNGIKDVAYIRNGILYVDRKVGYHLVTPDDNIFVYGIDQLRYSIGVRGILDSADATDRRQINLLSNMFIWNSSSEGDPRYIDSFTFRKGSGKGIFYFFFPKSYFTSTTANEILNEFKQKLSTNELDFQYVLSEPYTETIGQVDMPKTYKNISNITTTDELKPNLIVEYVRDTALSNYVEGQLQNERVTREEKMAEFNVAVDAISSRVSETETELNNNYTTTDELEQKLENQKSSVMKETSTLLEQTKSDFKFEILNQINQDGVERLKNTLVTINQEGINVAKSDDDVVSLLNNVGLYVSDGKLREDNSNLLMKTDRNGAYLKTSETKGTIKENEVIQKEKINHEKYGICQAWYWIGG